MDTHLTVPLEEPSEIQDPTTGELEMLRALKRAIERYGNPSLREIVRKGNVDSAYSVTLCVVA